MSEPLKALPDVLQPVLDRLALIPSRVVPIERARGLFLVEPLRGIAPVPPRAIALRSGLAVASLDVAGASPHSPVMLPRQPTAVAAGQALPYDCDAVIDPASVTQTGRMILVGDAVAPATNARLAGQDLESGAVIAPAWQRVTTETILACRLAGVEMATVRQPTFSIEIEDAAHAGWLADRISALGCSRIDDGRASDISVRTSQVSEPRIALLPGDTAWIEIAPGGFVIIHAPHRFDGLIAAYLALLVPVVAQLSGHRLHTFQLPLTRKVVSAIGMTELVLLRKNRMEVEPLAVGDVTVAALAQAASYCLIPSGVEGHAATEMLAVIDLDDPFGVSREEHSP